MRGEQCRLGDRQIMDTCMGSTSRTYRLWTGGTQHEASGCTNGSRKVITNEQILNICESTELFSFRLYPNPSPSNPHQRRWLSRHPVGERENSHGLVQSAWRFCSRFSQTAAAPPCSNPPPPPFEPCDLKVWLLALVLLSFQRRWQSRALCCRDAGRCCVCWVLGGCLWFPSGLAIGVFGSARM